MSGPEDNPADDVQPTKEEWERYEAAQAGEPKEVGPHSSTYPRYFVYADTLHRCDTLFEALEMNHKYGGIIFEKLGMSTAEKVNREDQQHASAPSGMKCSDCTIDGEACPACYSAWWRKRHPNVRFLPASEMNEPGSHGEPIPYGGD